MPRMNSVRVAYSIRVTCLQMHAALGERREVMRGVLADLHHLLDYVATAVACKVERVWGWGGRTGGEMKDDG
jgi:hypothetical protein